MQTKLSRLGNKDCERCEAAADEKKQKAFFINGMTIVVLMKKHFFRLLKKALRCLRLFMVS